MVNANPKVRFRRMVKCHIVYLQLDLTFRSGLVTAVNVILFCTFSARIYQRGDFTVINTNKI